jgi:hypothetical protein
LLAFVLLKRRGIAATADALPNPVSGRDWPAPRRTKSDGSIDRVSLVWAVIKGDLLTSGFWFLVYLAVQLVTVRIQARRRSAAGSHRTPYWARRALSAEEHFKLAQMRARRRRPNRHGSSGR